MNNTLWQRARPCLTICTFIICIGNPWWSARWSFQWRRTRNVCITSLTVCGDKVPTVVGMGKSQWRFITRHAWKKTKPRISFLRSLHIWMLVMSEARLRSWCLISKKVFNSLDLQSIPICSRCHVRVVELWLSELSLWTSMMVIYLNLVVTWWGHTCIIVCFENTLRGRMNRWFKRRFKYCWRLHDCVSSCVIFCPSIFAWLYFLSFLCTTDLHPFMLDLWVVYVFTIRFPIQDNFFFSCFHSLNKDASSMRQNPVTSLVPILTQTKGSQGMRRTKQFVTELCMLLQGKS